jgi:transcriptional regulator with XRE-family HTH domain
VTAEEFKAIRRERRQTEIEFARDLGYEGSDDTVKRLIRRIERGEKEITPVTALRAIELRNGTD